jgi:hypothetical protein
MLSLHIFEVLPNLRKQNIEIPIDFEKHGNQPLVNMEK